MIVSQRFESSLGLKFSAQRENFYAVLFSCSSRRISLFFFTSMSYGDIKSYVTHFSAFRVMICRFYEVCIFSKDSFDHYKRHHTAKKDQYVPMKAQHKIADYMTTLDLCQLKINSSDKRVSELKVIKDELMCKFPDCDACAVSEESMRKHYYVHQKSVPKFFKN